VGYVGHKHDLFLGPDFFTPFIPLFNLRSNPRGRLGKAFPPCSERPLMQDEPWRCGYYITFEKGGNRWEKNGEKD
jgi:hypothetical protein